MLLLTLNQTFSLLILFIPKLCGPELSAYNLVSPKLPKGLCYKGGPYLTLRVIADFYYYLFGEKLP